MEKKPKKKKKAGITVKAKKKSAVARAVIRKGTGKIKINNKSLGTVQQKYLRALVQEPVNLAGNLISAVDIEITAKGGGTMGQAVAARSAIAKALVEFTNDEKLKERFLNYDRLLLVDDVRRVEPKKPLGKKARKKKQKSKR